MRSFMLFFMLNLNFHRSTFIFRLLCTASSLSIAGWIYAIKSKFTLGRINEIILNRIGFDGIKVPNCIMVFIYSWWSYLIYFAVILGIAYWTTVVFERIKPIISLDEEKISGISSAGEEMGLTYFGLFFYALSVTDITTFVLTFLVLCIGLTLTTQHMFNPLYLFLGYNFYNVKTKKSTILLLSKSDYQYNDLVSFDNLVLLTPFTFVEIKNSNISVEDGLPNSQDYKSETR